jgi:hypothetical protein
MSDEELLLKLCDEINVKLWASHQEECARTGSYSGWSPFNPDAHRSVRVVFELFGVAGLHAKLAAQDAELVRLRGFVVDARLTVAEHRLEGGQIARLKEGAVRDLIVLALESLDTKAKEGGTC